MGNKYTYYPSVFSFFIIITIFATMGFQQIDTKNSEKVVAIHTDYGTMKVKLYNATPLHRDNFIKLVSQHYYDSLLFHRIIKNFMIQGGRPRFSTGKTQSNFGNGEPDYTIPTEFVDSLFHRKGVLASAREGDDVNPEMASSGSQFYIVQGRVFTFEELMILEAKRLKKYRSVEFERFMEDPKNHIPKAAYTAAMRAKNQEAITAIMAEINPKINARMIKYRYTDEQIQAYTTIGGTPHLDDAYTVFGEIIEGLDVLDTIASVPTGEFDRPVKDVRMWIEVIH